MRIAICAYDSENAVSGPATWFQRIPGELSKFGHDISAHIFWWENLERGTLVNFAHDAGIRHHTHKFSTSERNVNSLLKALAAAPPDILISDNVIPGLLATRFLKSAGIPNIGILRSDDPFYHAIIDRFAAGAEEDRVAAFVAVSEYLKCEAERRSEKRCLAACIPSGTPIPANSASFSHQQFQLIYVGRLVEEQKRISDTVSIMIRICREIPGTQGLIVGDGPERQKIETAINESGSPIRMTGRQSADQIQEHLSKSQAILLLSDYEGTPTAVMEAMAMGVVPICSHMRSGIPELVLPNNTGFQVSDRGDSVLAVVRQLFADSKLWHQYSAAARAHVTNRYSITSCVDRWNDLLIDLAEKKQPLGDIEIPQRYRLPRTHFAYAHQDIREPSLLRKLISLTKYYCARSRMTAGTIKKQLLRKGKP
jgi:colanic acid/amylovoran biosynthesis glycosyltransferase